VAGLEKLREGGSGWLRQDVSASSDSNRALVTASPSLTLNAAIDARCMTVEGDPALILDFDQWLKGT
jgi:hypothetical protein